MRKLTTLLMFFLFSVAQVWAQSRTVTGKVTDEKGGAVEGATVKATGSAKGTSTGKDGSFSLSVPANAKQLTISGVGLTTQNVTIPSSGSVSVSMVSDAGELGEVFISVPYGTIKKTNFTGSAAVVTAKEISKQQVTSLTNVLDGKIAGINSTNGGGQPGANEAAIRIRGIGSFGASNSPLYVVNGTPYDGNISSISTDDIEDIQVLKDAAASALYGSRAANGVVMVTTKKGKKSAKGANVNLAIRQGFMSRGIPEYDRVNQQQYYELMWEAMRNSKVYAVQGALPIAQANQFASDNLVSQYLGYNAYNVPNNKLIDPNTGKLNPNAKLLWNDRWEDALYAKSNRTNINLSMSNGSDKGDFYFSAGYLNENGLVVNSNFKRYTMTVDNNVIANSWLKAGLRLDGTYSTTAFSPSGSSAANNPFYFSRYVAPIYPVYLKDATTGQNIVDANGYPWDWGLATLDHGARPFQTNSNPVGSNFLDINATNTYQANASTYVEVKFTKNLSFKNTLGINFNEDRYKRYQNSMYGDAQNVHGRTTVSADRLLSLTANQVLTWNKSFGSHTIRILAGHENYLYKYDYLDATRINNQYPNLNDLDNDSTSEGQPSNYQDNRRIESYFSGLNYNFKETYLLSASFRRDGVSRFSPSNRWGNFYSVGAGWVLSRENFMKDIKWINDLKLRVSYGEQGNEAIGQNYTYRTWYGADGVGGYQKPTAKTNPNLVWENNRIYNIGADFTLFNKRLQGTIEYFNRFSSNLLFNVDLATSGGYSSIYKNIGELKNYGIELTLGYNVVQKKNFDWRVDVNFTSFKNVMLTIPDEWAARGGYTYGVQRIAVGHSIYDFYTREFAGVDVSSGKSLYYADVVDANQKPTGQRVLTDEPNKASLGFVGGSALPKFSGGITNSIRFKNWDFSCLFAYSYGGKYYDGQYAGLMSMGSPGTTWSTDIAQRWQKPGDVTNVPRVQIASGLDAASSRFLVDGSYLNFKNMTLSYSVPKAITNKIKMSGISMFLSMDNVMLWTAKKGGNPQQSFSGSTSPSYFPVRTTSVGLNFNF